MKTKIFFYSTARLIIFEQKWEITHTLVTHDSGRNRPKATKKNCVGRRNFFSTLQKNLDIFLAGVSVGRPIHNTLGGFAHNLLFSKNKSTLSRHSAFSKIHSTAFM